MWRLSSSRELPFYGLFERCSLRSISDYISKKSTQKSRQKSVLTFTFVFTMLTCLSLSITSDRNAKRESLVDVKGFVFLVRVTFAPRPRAPYKCITFPSAWGVWGNKSLSRLPLYDHLPLILARRKRETHCSRYFIIPVQTVSLGDPGCKLRELCESGLLPLTFCPAPFSLHPPSPPLPRSPSTCTLFSLSHPPQTRLRCTCIVLPRLSRAKIK